MKDERRTDMRAFYVMQAFQVALLVLIGTIAILAYRLYGYASFSVVAWICGVLLVAEMFQLIFVWVKRP